MKHHYLISTDCIWVEALQKAFLPPLRIRDRMMEACYESFRACISGESQISSRMKMKTMLTPPDENSNRLQTLPPHSQFISRQSCREIHISALITGLNEAAHNTRKSILMTVHGVLQVKVHRYWKGWCNWKQIWLESFHLFPFSSTALH